MLCDATKAEAGDEVIPVECGQAVGTTDHVVGGFGAPIAAVIGDDVEAVELTAAPYGDRIAVGHHAIGPIAIRRRGGDRASSYGLTALRNDESYGFGVRMNEPLVIVGTNDACEDSFWQSDILDSFLDIDIAEMSSSSSE